MLCNIRHNIEIGFTAFTLHKRPLPKYRVEIEKKVFLLLNSYYLLANKTEKYIPTKKQQTKTTNKTTTKYPQQIFLPNLKRDNLVMTDLISFRK